ncbi:ABC transporter permease subunit [Acuticoccus sp. MNP-M23]|uniref:ABC transporter permease n=1 Tax=Acuticoccus sp. MNP-M23 TaxID=3072793 RepID=UPI002815C861|nr:ABC transporter permease subunit [Acuticoccus sp. MNP-M23]WMS42684.1 ABC transporter permease subunit [Acuticoccus sp. MNP-M23]
MDDSLFGLLRFGPGGWGDELLLGLRITLLLALATAPIGLVGGFLLALARRSDRPVLRFCATAFTTVFKGLPELITLFIVYYGFSMLLAWFVGLFSDAYVEVSSFVAGMIALGAVSASFASEVFMAALGGIAKGQTEAADALGISRFTTMRKVILPQLIRIALPGLGNLWLVLLKDTALVSVIALPDLLRQTSIAVGATKEPFFFFAVAIGIYFVISLASMAVIALLEKRYAKAYAR